MNFTREIMACVANRARPLVEEFASKYDYSKYPANALEYLQGAFSERRIRAGDISQALLWKWGHIGKHNYPLRHRNLIGDAEGYRQELLSRPAADKSSQTFEFWSRALGHSTRFISRAFLTHLQHHAELAIIDQHNWRAMRWLLAECRYGVLVSKLPHSYNDLLALSGFVRLLSENLATPTDRVDRFLMMFGKSLKKLAPA